MQWLYYALAAMFLWGIEKPFTNGASRVHGFKVTLIFQTIALIFLAVFFGWSARTDFNKITFTSTCNAAFGGLMSALALYFLLRAFHTRPDKISSIALIIGAYPIITMLAATFAGQQELTAKNMGGALLISAGLALITL